MFVFIVLVCALYFNANKLFTRLLKYFVKDSITQILSINNAGNDTSREGLLRCKNERLDDCHRFYLMFFGSNLLNAWFITSIINEQKTRWFKSTTKDTDFSGSLVPAGEQLVKEMGLFETQSSGDWFLQSLVLTWLAQSRRSARLWGGTYPNDSLIARIEQLPPELQLKISWHIINNMSDRLNKRETALLGMPNCQTYNIRMVLSYIESIMMAKRFVRSLDDMSGNHLYTGLWGTPLAAFDKSNDTGRDKNRLALSEAYNNMPRKFMALTTHFFGKRNMTSDDADIVAPLVHVAKMAKNTC